MNPVLLIAIIVLAFVLLVIAGIAIIRAQQFTINLGETEAIDLPRIDGEQVAKHIGLALELRTISHNDYSKTDQQAFIGLRHLLKTLYPMVFERLTLELINDHAMLFTWQGSDPSLDAIAFASHQDVVPADEGPDSPWTYPPFSGTLADGYVWGRGALDTKGSLIGTLEAVNNLLREGFEPLRTIYLVFGHDEEVSGTYGAKVIAETLESRGVRLAFLIDEGGAISRDTIPGVKSPVGLIGVAEKGHVSLKIRAEVAPGHAAYPSKDTAIGALSLAIATLEANPFPQTLDMLEFMMSFVGEELPFTRRLVLANPWLFGNAVKRACSADRNINSITRTTLSPTIIRAGNAENVLPGVAEAIVNIRIMPGETLSSVYEYVRDLVSDDIISVLPAHGDQLIGNHSWDPVDISDIDSPHFQVLYHLIRSTFPGALATPILMPGATDARHYRNICKRIFRFTPIMIDPEETNRIHGIDERLSFENAARMVGFYQILMQRMSSLSAAADQGFSQGPNELDESFEAEAIRELNEALPTRPVREQPPAAQVFEPSESFESPISSKAFDAPEWPSETESSTPTAETLSQEELDALYEDDFDDNAPLQTKPIKKD